uniref:SKI-interacting protein SKIP SNW domain-containing protein n=1 Tax=Trypanosoma congolense (strain IL3000) TaxID=1068625 RepID=G0UTT7_TRYCI|nr:conserved hypothetical protein [Trypanosoma congolense IL3000]
MYGSNDDGGAFAEYHYAQYPLGLGKELPPLFVRAAAAALQKKMTATSVLAAGQANHSALVAVPNRSETPSNSCEVDGGDRLVETTRRTKEALELALKEQLDAEDERDLSGRTRRFREQKKPALELALPANIGETGLYDPAPIVRSPTREPKKSTDSMFGDGEDSTGGSVVVPFSISNWKNKRKLIISLDQRLAHQAEVQPVGGGKISDNVMQLAIAMQQARRDVEAEQIAREKARREEEERLQAEREAEATKRAREILEKAADVSSSSVNSRKETREERLERIRLERDLREREKQQEARHRRLVKAAARLGMTVEALEADDDLLRNVDNPTAARSGLVPDVVGMSRREGGPLMDARGTETERPPTIYADEEEGVRPSGTSAIRKGVFGSAVISNEGIRREMEALAKLEAQGSEPKDGLRLAGDGEASSAEEDEDDGLGVDKLMKRRKRRL